jgi:hypothetical protein
MPSRDSGPSGSGRGAAELLGMNTSLEIANRRERTQYLRMRERRNNRFPFGLARLLSDVYFRAG